MWRFVILLTFLVLVSMVAEGHKKGPGGKKKGGPGGHKKPGPKPRPKPHPGPGGKKKGGPGGHKKPGPKPRPKPQPKVNGKYGEWSSWTSCSTDCGNGVRTRQRKCNSPAPQNGGRGCVGSAAGRKGCKSNINCPVNGKYGRWSSWTSCSTDCGNGVRTRQRKCNSPAPQNGGKGCVGSATGRKGCKSNINCPVDGMYGPWTLWTLCSKDCGGGIKLRSRQCDSPAPKNGGKDCFEPPIQEEDCNTETCAVATTAPTTSKSVLNEDKCGKTSSYGRIVGGTAAQLGDWPWQIGIIKYSAPGAVFCGGTLINSRTVLTAAHCFLGVSDPNAADYYVRIGALNLTDDSNSTDIDVADIYRHQGFLRRTFVNDIAVMILTEDVIYDSFVGSACVSVDKSDISNMVNNKCSITGWGRLAEGGSTSTVLQQAKVPIVEMQTCKDSFNSNPRISIRDGMFCAGDGNGIDACQGDSGGPLVCKQDDGRYFLHGIVSWGIGCARVGTYGVYTKVSDFTEWIKVQINSSK